MLYLAVPGRVQECPDDGSHGASQEGAPGLPCTGGPSKAGKYAPHSLPWGHSPEALQECHVAQSLSEHSQGGAAQWEVAEAGGEEATGGLSMAGLGSPTWTPSARQ